MIAPVDIEAPAAAPVPSLPFSVRTMIDTAYRSGDTKTIAAIVSVAKASFPDQRAEIDQIAAADEEALTAIQHEEQERAQARIAEARFLDLWKGEIEAGAARSTGSTDTLALYTAAAFNRDGIRWRQKITGRIDFQQTNKATTAERAVLAWQPQYKLDERLYTYALGQYEHDRFIGYDNRATIGAGLGYSAVVRSNLKVDFEGGPAVRYTEYAGPASHATVAGRASVQVRWTLSDNLVLVQAGALYLEDHDRSATTTTSLDTKLIGDLKARFSYNVQYERSRLNAVDRLDTISRATLVYGF